MAEGKLNRVLIGSIRRRQHHLAAGDRHFYPGDWVLGLSPMTV